MMDIRAAARCLEGEISGTQILAPGPGHSRGDRSLSVRLDASAPDGFVVNSFAGDDPIICKDYVRQRLGLPPFKTNGHKERPPINHRPADDDAHRTKRALEIWNQARDPRGTLVERYLQGRGVTLPDDCGEVVRFHNSCLFGRALPRQPCMVALVRNIETNAPQAVHRTALNPDGAQQRDQMGKTARLSLGPVHGGAIKLTADVNVTLCLGVGEGIETTLSLQRQSAFGQSPVWSLVSAGGFGWLPLLPGIESLWIAVDNDSKGKERAEELSRRWADAGREVFTLMSRVEGDDLNDAVRAA
jgi:putative DNA primase/helicase